MDRIDFLGFTLLLRDISRLDRYSTGQDIQKRNQALPSMMKAVWTLVVLYSGPFGIGLYRYASRTQTR